MPRKPALRSRENVPLMNAETNTGELADDKNTSGVKANNFVKDGLKQREALQSIENFGKSGLGIKSACVISHVASTPTCENVIANVRSKPEFAPFLSTEVENLDFGDYSGSVLEYFGYLENYAIVPECFMSIQTEIDDSMRAVLVDWIVSVHRMFDLVQETLFITIQILDKYISTKFIRSDDFQLVGITCLLIASKYEERAYPALQHYAKVTEDTYTMSQIIEMESEILNSIDFDLCAAVSIQFLRRITITCQFTSAPHNLAKYFIEVCLTDGYMSHFRPSLIAGAAIYLSLVVFKLVQMTSQVELVSGYTLEQMMPVIKRIPGIIERNEQQKLNAVYKKYLLRGVGSISNLPQLKISHFKNLTYFS